ncbi:MAG: class I SAM-dependent methyltransferase [Planctomycetota bacterium]|jgi:SAM-dependent methyltransferase
MCDQSCLRWGVQNLTAAEIKGKRIIEVGSYDVNGSFRYFVELFEPAEYIGVDIAEGPGVDIVCPAENLVNKFGNGSFDVVISTCSLEHIKEWKRAISNIKNICISNGLILIIVPSEAPLHEFPDDYWRYKKEDIKNIFSDCDILVLEELVKAPFLRSLFNLQASIVYTKIRKSPEFIEKDLSTYQLYSMIYNKRVSEISSSDLNGEHRSKFTFRRKIKQIVLKVVCSIQLFYLKNFYIKWIFKMRH